MLMLPRTMLQASGFEDEVMHAVEMDNKEVTQASPDSVYHALFNSPDADVVLGSKDEMLFRVHSFTLKTTSGWFNSMFTLPQKSGQQSSTPVYLEEESSTLEALLRCICGLDIPRLDSFDAIEPLLYAAEKYDMSGPVSIVRALVMTPSLLSDPLRLFVIACRYGWEDIAQLAATKTLTLDLLHPSHRTSLQKLTSIPLLALFDFHRGRRNALQARLNGHPFVDDQGTSTCSHCGGLVNYHTWRELKFVIIREMDVRPLGDTVYDVGLREWPEAQRCWDAHCSSCNRVLYDKKETLRAIKECIDQLPTSINLSSISAANSI